MNDRRSPHIIEDMFGAGLSLATDEASDASIGRRRMLVALEATRAIEQAIGHQVVAVTFAALRNDKADPLDLDLEFAIGRTGHQDPEVRPAFTFNLRDAYVAGTNDGADAEAVERIQRILPALEGLVAQMRRNVRGVYRAVPRDEAVDAVVAEPAGT